MKLKGRRAVITGSSSGIGRAIAKLLAVEGAKVVINARGTREGGVGDIDKVVDEIRASGGTAIGVAGAINEPAFAERLIGACVDEFGGIDILVNNAAIYCPQSIGPVTGCPIDIWRETVDVNLNAVFHTSRAALPHMVKQRWGRILNASSLAGTGYIGGSAYSASKSALTGFGRAMASDYGPYGITINTYNPEARTPMGDFDDQGFAQMVRSWVNRGYRTEAFYAYTVDTGRPEGVAPWIAYLCLDEADYINGRTFAVEGRRVAMIANPDEQQVLYRDCANQGPWPLGELSLMAPRTFNITNTWPRRTEEDLAKWEKA